MTAASPGEFLQGAIDAVENFLRAFGSVIDADPVDLDADYADCEHHIEGPCEVCLPGIEDDW
ncbi:hypothetical protein SEA_RIVERMONSTER_2 [Mycobacterium phage RiverMonster]|nr:hypothetical protein SEA_RIVERMONSTER_2 [Mycobacterium phage RiverMonster]